METDFGNSVGMVQTQTIRLCENNNPLRLVCGKSLAPIDVAYETYGKLDAGGNNAILICHALSGDAHAAGYNSANDRKPGWWDIMIGPGKGIDTNKYFVICSNFLGGCRGTTGPLSINPATGKPYGTDFPMITIADMVHVQKMLMDKLGIKRLLAVIGGSMGGMQVLQWAIEYPDFVVSAIVIASTAHLSAQSIAFDAVGRNAILADPDFQNGQYTKEKNPAQGLAMARMIGHITYLSEESMRQKFGRQLRSANDYQYDFNSEFSVETYLDYQGQAFVERFDANSYLYITKAMDYFDLVRDHGSLEKAFQNVKSRFLITSFTSDWLFTPQQAEEMVDALLENNKDVSYCNIYSPYGHDAFLLEPEIIGRLISGFLSNTMNTITGCMTSPRDFAPVNSFKIIDRAKRARLDYELIESLIEPNSRVLDVGCGDGQLLHHLIFDKHITAMGIEVDQNRVIECVNKGINIVHRDIDRGLEKLVDNSFDYAILSQTLQTVKDPQKVFAEMLRVGIRVIVSFPNFAHWLCRWKLFFDGIAPRTRELPFKWYNSPNIHFLSLKDFEEFCDEIGARIENRIPLRRGRVKPVRILPNIFAEEAIYVTTRK